MVCWRRPITVIAWDGKTLAADRRICYGTMICEVTKIRRHGRLLIGASGDGSLANEMIAWVCAGADPATFPAAQRTKDDWQPVMVISHGPTVALYERSPHPCVHEQGRMAIGSGREFAMAAMHLGKSAREAVEVACALDNGCGNGIDTLELLAPEISLRAV